MGIPLILIGLAALTLALLAWSRTRDAAVSRRHPRAATPTDGAFSPELVDAGDAGGADCSDAGSGADGGCDGGGGGGD